MHDRSLSDEYALEFFYVASVVAHVSRVPVPSSPEPESVQFPNGSYAFRIMHRKTVSIDEERLKTDWKNTGPIYYHPDSVLKTRDEIEHIPGNETLLSNMKCSNWPAVVYTRYGNWPQPFDPERVVILSAVGVNPEVA